MDTLDGTRPREVLESCRWTLEARERRGGAGSAPPPPLSPARTPAGDDVADAMPTSGSDDRDARVSEVSATLPGVVTTSARGMTTAEAARGGGGGGV